MNKKGECYVVQEELFWARAWHNLQNHVYSAKTQHSHAVWSVFAWHSIGSQEPKASSHLQQ